MGKIESFPNEALLIERIEKYLAEGIKEEQMTVLATAEMKTVGSKYQNIRNQSKDIGPWDKFVSAISMKSGPEKEMEKLDLSDHEKSVYRKELEENQKLLYVG